MAGPRTADYVDTARLHHDQSSSSSSSIVIFIPHHPHLKLTRFCTSLNNMPRPTPRYYAIKAPELREDWQQHRHFEYFTPGHALAKPPVSADTVGRKQPCFAQGMRRMSAESSMGEIEDGGALRTSLGLGRLGSRVISKTFSLHPERDRCLAVWQETVETPHVTQAGQHAWAQCSRVALATHGFGFWSNGFSSGMYVNSYARKWHDPMRCRDSQAQGFVLLAQMSARKTSYVNAN